jgi:hypothetical protein
MALNYTYTKYKDVHTLKNDESISMDYEIIKDLCEASTSIYTGTIQPGSTVTINFATDGNYTIDLSTALSTDSFTVETFQNLLTSFIADAEKLLCGCAKCDECAECNECQDYLGAFMKSQSFNSISYPTYQNYVNLITQNGLCDFTDEVICTIVNEKVFGSASAKEPMLKILSYYYAAFYYKDYGMATDTEEATYITTKYKFGKISKCIKKLGVNLEDITNEASIVYYWQLTNILDDINDIIPLLNPAFIATKPNLPFPTFEQGHIVNYTEIGRICFAIAPTQVQNFTVTDSLNNDITDEFDVYYNTPMSLALFVSKIAYSFSNIYFKFKKLV